MDTEKFLSRITRVIATATIWDKLNRKASPVYENDIIQCLSDPYMTVKLGTTTDTSRIHKGVIYYVIAEPYADNRVIFLMARWYENTGHCVISTANWCEYDEKCVKYYYERREEMLRNEE